MDADEAVLAALNDLRVTFPAMRVRTEHVVLERESTVFRATLVLPGGAEATGYGSVAGAGPSAIAAAEHLALARAMAFLGIDPDTLEIPDGLGEPAPVAMPGSASASAPEVASRGAPERRVAEEPPADPFNLGPTPSPADVAAATGMRLGARPNGDRPTPTRSAERPAPASSRQPDPVPEPESDMDDEPERFDRPVPAAPRASSPAGAAAEGAGDSDDDVAVSHQAFWRWAGDHGLENRTDVEELLGRSIGGLRPAAVRDLIIAARDGADPENDDPS